MANATMMSRLRLAGDQNPALRHLGFGFALVALTFLVHGHALTEGLFLDDHWHWSQWAQQDWSAGSWADDTTIEPARFIHLWWQDQPVRFQYFRPVSVAVAKGVYRWLGADPYWLHLLSILLHGLNSCLVYGVGVLLTRRAFWPAVGGAIFIIYSHNIYAVSWLAAQNIVLQTTFALLLIFLYIYRNRETSGWNRSSVVGCILLLGLALLTRENAVILPLFLMAIDFARGGIRTIKQRWRFHLACWLCVGVFLVLRASLCDASMPKVYVRYPDDLTYIPWAAAKLLHYVTASIWLSPMTIGPSGRDHPFSEVPGDCLLMIGIIAVLGFGYWRACRNVRGYWLWPLWIVLSLLPVVPVMATPHSGYLPSVGFSLALILGPATRKHDETARNSKFRHYFHGSALVAGWFVIANWIYQPIYRGLWSAFRSAERYTIDQIMMDPPDDQVEHVFLLNLPFVNIYAPIHLFERGVDRVEPHQYHVLTFAPHVLTMTETPVLHRLDERSFTMRIENTPLFSGLLGRFLIESMRSEGAFRVGDRYRGEEFEVEVVDAVPAGVRELKFTFKAPLHDPRYRFYMGTESCPAAALKFLNQVGDSAGWRDRFEVVESTNEGLEYLRRQRGRLEEMRAETAKYIRTDLYLSGPPYRGPG